MKITRGKRRARSRGQGAVEYIMMIAFGSIFALQIAKYFNDVFRDGVRGLETNIQTDLKTGQGYGP
jgi:hypothetical protein